MSIFGTDWLGKAKKKPALYGWLLETDLFDDGKHKPRIRKRFGFFRQHGSTSGMATMDGFDSDDVVETKQDDSDTEQQNDTTIITGNNQSKTQSLTQTQIQTTDDINIIDADEPPQILIATPEPPDIPEDILAKITGNVDIVEQAKTELEQIDYDENDASAAIMDKYKDLIHENLEDDIDIAVDKINEALEELDTLEQTEQTLANIKALKIVKQSFIDYASNVESNIDKMLAGVIIKDISHLDDEELDEYTAKLVGVHDALVQLNQNFATEMALKEINNELDKADAALKAYYDGFDSSDDETEQIINDVKKQDILDRMMKANPTFYQNNNRPLGLNASLQSAIKLNKPSPNPNTAQNLMNLHGNKPSLQKVMKTGNITAKSSDLLSAIRNKGKLKKPTIIQPQKDEPTDPLVAGLLKIRGAITGGDSGDDADNNSGAGDDGWDFEADNLS